jgi:hypothetical protein
MQPHPSRDIMQTFSNYGSNVYSQFGEDGIIQEIFFRLSSAGVRLNHWACEFGAWDGLDLSNTARLIKQEGYRAVLIEGDPRRVQQLERNFPSPAVIKLCSFVTPRGTTSLESLLAPTEIPRNFDLLSIDIDGLDYFILQSIQSYRPKLICIEFNPTIPNAVHFVQEPNGSVKHGSSAKAIIELGILKGYVAIAATRCNLLLLEKELAAAIGATSPGIDELVPHGIEIQCIFSGYDGSLLSNKPFVELAWHGNFPLEQIQPLPKFLRKYSGDYSRYEAALFRLLFFLKNPGRTGKLKRKIGAIFRTS